MRAARHGRSMEAEIRAILMDAVWASNASEGLFTTLLDRFGDLGGAELDLPSRTMPARAADLGR